MVIRTSELRAPERLYSILRHPVKGDFVWDNNSAEVIGGYLSHAYSPEKILGESSVVIKHTLLSAEEKSKLNKELKEKLRNGLPFLKLKEGIPQK